jgi:FtsP/CotA-like multicopper oxidase with cupredoxin domain
VIADCFHPQCITADGLERGVMSINRQIPGPPIHVCHNDLVIVDVTNRVGGGSASIHWHGFHQRDTPFMDGVPFITQCPIQFGTTFRYAFRATQAGTQFYHSHSGHHKVNGQYGAFVVRQPRQQDVNSVLYNHDLPEHTIVASDWMNYTADMFMRGNPTLPPGIDPTSLLINGRGVTRNVSAPVICPLKFRKYLHSIARHRRDDQNPTRRLPRHPGSIVPFPFH